MDRSVVCLNGIWTAGIQVLLLTKKFFSEKEGMRVDLGFRIIVFTLEK